MQAAETIPAARQSERENSPLAAVHSQQILDSYHQRTIAEIAAEFGVSDVAIYLKLLREVPEEWKEHQAAKALSEFEAAEQEFRNCGDMLSLARAREAVRSAAWKLERTCRRIYGQQIEVKHEVGDNVVKALASANELLSKFGKLKRVAGKRQKAIAAAQTERIIAGTVLNELQDADS